MLVVVLPVAVGYCRAGTALKKRIATRRKKTRVINFDFEIVTKSNLFYRNINVGSMLQSRRYKEIWFFLFTQYFVLYCAVKSGDKR